MTAGVHPDAEWETKRPTNPAQPYFAREGSGYEPMAAAVSGWSADMVAGPAALGLLAHVLDGRYGDDKFFPARLTADLFRPVRMCRTDVRSRIIRWGNRIRLVESELIQSGESVARATVVSYRRSANATGDHWVDPRVPQPPSPAEHPGERLIGTSGENAEWGPLPQGGPAWRTSDRKRIWTTEWSVIEGEATTPFVRAAMVADLTNLVTNMGTDGIGYINGDVTLALTRLPEGSELGLEADSHRACNGVAVGSATMFDRRGSLGICTVSAIENGRRTLQRPEVACARVG
ncbi:acyl-CoA thioesterase domain-containing protein [Rhodococcus sp. NPDC057014]|uniref:acyl-CoA thioesterase domain-containing protein n=1 Tax=unclassified Rhodococcus (in: high G+C Gram-positive bacteria) TaxID=192944 RepID=UPI003629B35A